MTLHNKPGLALQMLDAKMTRYQRTAALALLLLAGSVLLGWLLRSPLLTTWGAGRATTAPLTAICLFVAAIGLLVDERRGGVWRQACGGFVAIAGLLGLLQITFQVDWGVGVRAVAPVDGSNRFLLSEMTAVLFILVGAALAIGRRTVMFVRVVSGIVSLVGVLTVLDLLVTLGERHLPGLGDVALPTAVGMMLAGAGLFAFSGPDFPELPLKVVLGGLVIAALLPAFVFMVSQTRRMAEQQIEAIRTAGGNAVDDIGSLVDRVLGERIALLRGLATSPALRPAGGIDGVPNQADQAIFHAQVRTATAGSLGWIILTDGAGHQLVNSRRDAGATQGGLIPLSTITSALESGVPQVSDVHTSVTRHDVLLISISYPVPNTRLALNWRVPVDEFSEALRRISPAGWIYSIADREGRLVARNRDQDKWAGKQVTPSAWTVASASRSGWAKSLTLEGVTAYTSWKRLESGWTALSGVSEESITLPGRIQNRRLTFGAALMTVLGLLFATLGAILISRPLLKFSTIGEVNASTEQAAVRGGIVVREISALAQTLSDAARDRQRATAALAESEARLQRFVDQAPAAIAMFDNDMRYLAVSQRWLTYFAPDDTGLVGKLHADVVPLISESWKERHRRGLAGQVVAANNDVFVKPDGSQQFIRWEVRPWRTADGAVGGITIFAEDVTEGAVAEAALKESEARLKAIVDTATDAIVVLDPNGKIESVNTSAEAMFGFSAGEAIGKNVMTLVIGSDEGRAAGDGMAGFMDLGREVTGVRKDGTHLPIDLSIAEWAVGGRTHYTCIMRDVSIRKERENHVRLVMRELSHRTKNVLAVVQAMAWQTSRKTTSADEFQQQFTQRVDGLSRSIGLLVRSEWEGVSVRDLVEGQLAPFLDDATSRLVCDGVPLLLKPNGAQDLGLVLHELATNASKYGALSVASGRVATSWEVIARGDAKNVFRFLWQEIGGPRVEEPQHMGFGSTLIKDMMAKTYKARIAFEFEPEGLRWYFEMDADRIIAYDGRGTKSVRDGFDAQATGDERDR